MMDKVTGRHIGDELVKALNLRDDVTSVHIKIMPDELIEITTTHDINKDEAERLVELLSKYNLTPKE